MTYRYRVVATVLSVVLVVPVAFFSVPQRAHAIPVADAGNLVQNTITAIQTSISAVSDVTSAAAEYALYIDKYILEPIAFVTSGNAIRSITAGMIDFINGKSNGTGQSQFVQGLQVHLQGVGDGQALAFFVQFGKNSNSPFAQAINSSLRAQYYQQTSLAGFFDANQCTLYQHSPNQNAYLAGDWSQGGTGAWLALTTQDQNNPYTLHQRAQSELSAMVQSKTASRLEELAWGGGFLSWCGGSAADNADELAPGTEGSIQTGPPSPDTLPPGTEGSTQQGPPAPDGESAGAKPGDPCTNSDGTPGTIQTPGSAIKSYLDKALGLDADKIAQMGNTSAQITSILGDISTLMQTASFATSVLGSASIYGATGGLAGSSPYANQDRRGYLGVTEESVLRGAGSHPVTNGQQLLDNASRYEKAWAPIESAATAAAATVTAIINTCTAAADASKVTAAQSALETEINPVLADAEQAARDIAEARAVVQRIQSNTATAADLRDLNSKPPTATDIATVEQKVLPEGEDNKATADPNGSLTVSGGKIIDQMKLISKNAQKMLNSCSVSATL